MREISLVDEGNRDFLEGKSHYLATQQEAWENIKHCKCDSPATNKKAMACSGLLGSCFVLMGISFFVITLLGYLTSEDLKTIEALPEILLMLTASIALAVSFGYRFLASSYIVSRKAFFFKLNHLYNQLVCSKSITCGEIAGVQILAEKPGQIIHYAFVYPETNEIVRGRYITSNEKTFYSGGKVAVLYFDAHLHILL